MAIGPIKVTGEREAVVDFTVPFYEPVGLALMRKHFPIIGAIGVPIQFVRSHARTYRKNY